MSFTNFIKDESGAITVDWVVLTAAIVGIAIAVLLVIAGGLNSAANSTSTGVGEATSVANLIGGSNGSAALGNLNDDYTRTPRPPEHDTNHEHYTNNETGDDYRYNTETNELSAGAQGNGGVVGTVDPDGNVSAV